MMSVDRLLITGTQDQLMRATLATGYVANWHEQRGQTVYGSVMSEDVDRVIPVLKAINITIQEMRERKFGEPEKWKLVHQGELGPWVPEELP